MALKLFLLAVALSCADASIRQQWDRTLELAISSETASYPARWFDKQLLDHFTNKDPRTWRQRYWENFDYFQPGGPVILVIGGEGPMQSNRVGPSTYVYASMAQQMRGAVVCLEHRFYGDSQPFGDSLATAHLPYLTSRQALSDVAHFQRWLTARRSLQSSPFLCTGGSYAGNLAAWYRMEFPELTAGCWAASAPVQAVAIWPGFGQMVWRAFSRDALGNVDESLTVKLYAGYQMLAELIQDPTPDSGIELRERLNVCPGTLVSQGDRDNWEATFVTAVGGVMQENTSATVHLGQLRALVARAETPLDAAFAVSDFLNLTHGPSCRDNSIASFYRVIENTSVPFGVLGLTPRPWMWQSCNEFGYFQTASAVLGVPNFYTRGTSSRALSEGMCADVFGISDLSARVAATNAYYGGSALSSERAHKLTNVLFSNGEFDAWSLLSVTNTLGFHSRELHAVVGEMGSHCEGINAPAAGEIPGATRVRQAAMRLFTQWSQIHRNLSDVVVAFV